MPCPSGASLTGSIQFPCVLPVALVEEAGVVLFVIVLAGVAYNTWRWKKTLPFSEAHTLGAVRFLRKVPSGAARILASEVAIQRSALNCGETFWVSHFFIFWGFIGAAATTTLLYFFHNDGTALPLTDPTKLLGNLSAVLLTVGGFVAIQRRLRDPLVRMNTLRYDSFFLVLLYGTTVTGVFTEVSRLSLLPALAYTVYFLHLAFVALLLGLAPWTKFAHAIYRPIVSLIDWISVSRELDVETDPPKPRTV